MKKLYYCITLCAILLGGAVHVSHAQFVSGVGLRSDAVRMSSLEKMEATYMTPAYAAFEAVAQRTGAPSLMNAMPERDEQTLGAGLIYGSKIEKLGLQLTYFYFMTTALALGGDFSFFFPEKIDLFGSKITLTTFTLNVVAHYVFYSSLILRTYALGGLNYAVFRSKTSGEIGNFSDSTSEIGLNLGGGLEYVLARGLLYLELKYIISDADQLVLALGYRHKLGQ